MWGLLEKPWVRRVGRIESVGAFGSMLWEAIKGLYGWLTGASFVTGAALAIVDGYGWVAVGLIALTFALTAAIILFLLASAQKARSNPPPTAERATETTIASPRGLLLEDGVPPKPMSEREERALDDLSAFVTGTLLDVVEDLAELQIFLLRHAEPKEMARFIRQGVFRTRPLVSDMYESFAALSDLGSSPAREFSLEEMMHHVSTIEKTYHAFVEQLLEIAGFTRHLSMSSQKEVEKRWASWKNKHDDLAAGYEKIKNDRRFTALYRPRRESRWDIRPTRFPLNLKIQKSPREQ